MASATYLEYSAYSTLRLLIRIIIKIDAQIALAGRGLRSGLAGTVKQESVGVGLLSCLRK